MSDNKYTMSVEENIFYAKRNIIDSIWKEANIEGIAVTFPQTKEIYEGRVVSGLTVDQTVAVNNLKHGWQFILDTLDVPVDLPYVRQINQLVGQGVVFHCGELRVGGVAIGGTDWKPDLPDYDTAQTMIKDITNEPAGQDRALHMFMALCRAQLFNDGNKRTAQLVANRMLIADGAGILAIPVKYKPRFEELLVGYYETGKQDDLMAFLTEHGLDGVDHPQEKQPDAVSLDTEVSNALQAAKSYTADGTARDESKER